MSNLRREDVLESPQCRPRISRHGDPERDGYEATFRSVDQAAQAIETYWPATACICQEIEMLDLPQVTRDAQVLTRVPRRGSRTSQRVGTPITPTLVD